jgi:hypothetical protein
VLAEFLLVICNEPVLDRVVDVQHRSTRLQHTLALCKNARDGLWSNFVEEDV